MYRESTPEGTIRFFSSGWGWPSDRYPGDRLPLIFDPQGRIILDASLHLRGEPASILLAPYQP
jgi:hypothetical protein